MTFINSTVSEKIEINKKIEQLKTDLHDLFDKYASANENLFNMVDTDLMKLNYKVMRFNGNLKNWFLTWQIKQ